MALLDQVLNLADKIAVAADIKQIFRDDIEDEVSIFHDDAASQKRIGVSMNRQAEHENYSQIFSVLGVTDKAVTRISFYPDEMDSTYKMKQKMKKLFWATLLSQIVLLSACQQTADNTDIPQVARLSFANGSSISDGTYEDYNPVMVQLTNGKRVLVFISNRPCRNIDSSE